MKIRSNNKFNWYGLLRLFKRGSYLAIKPTLRCNLSCNYCGAEMEGSSCWIDPADEINLTDWISYIVGYEEKYGQLKQITITGGEPFLYTYLPSLVRFLLNKKIFVYIFSNLTAPYVELPKSNHLKIKATYHKESNKVRFKSNLAQYSQRCFVITQELLYTWFGNPENDKSAKSTIPGSLYRKEKFGEDISQLEVDSIGPNGKLYPKDANVDYKKYDKARSEKSGAIANPLRKNKG